MENKSGSNNNALKIILGIAVVLLVGTAFYTFNLKKETDETQKQLTEEKAIVLKDLNNMAQQYDIAIGDNEVANKKLVEARDRIGGLMDSLKVSDNNVRSLWRYKKQFLALQDEMEALMEVNSALKASNSMLATSLDSTKVKLNERIVFNDSLLAQNTEFATIVEDAAVLSTVGLKGFGVIVRSSGKLIPTERAGRSDKVRICYTVAKNKLVAAGDKEFFVQVLDPNDNVLGLNEQIQFDDSVLNYSLISKFNYESDNLDICEFVEAKGKDFEKGRYIVNVFDQKNLVSTSQFELD